MSQKEKDLKEIEDIKGVMEEDAQLERMKQDIAKKKAIVDQKKYTALANQIEQDERDLELAKNMNLDALTPDQVAGIQKANMDYMEAARSCMRFICETFEGFVPFFQKNLILIGAVSGAGKSTAAANIAYRTMQQTSSVTGKKCKVLIITNEEQSEDFYNRVTCLNKGWLYSNHSAFSQDQRNTFDRAIPLLAKDGRLTVIDDDFGGAHGMTTSLEGIESIFEKLIKDGTHYDCIIFDYYQNVITSKTDPTMDEYQVQARLSRMLDHYKNTYPAPIVVMSQLKPTSTENPLSFKERIEGRKIIFNYATIAMEIDADRKALATKWTIWKNRFNAGIGDAVRTGFDKGMYVQYTHEFVEKVDKMRNEQEARAQDRALNRAIGAEAKEKMEQVNGEKVRT